MKQLLVLSGKGGTGKTTVAAALIQLSSARAYADCDVDAPNLHLLMDWHQEGISTDFYGMPKAKIDLEKCIQCGKCAEICRFHAVDKKDSLYEIDPYGCEGCGFCEVVCPVGAIRMEDTIAGDLLLYSADTVFSTAKLRMGQGTSGLLVTEVKKQLKDAVIEAEWAIIDGSPGIGCPVIASLSGVDQVLLIAEPSISGISDLKRIVMTARHFQIPMKICINKYDINLEKTKEIEAYCESESLELVGKIPFDPFALQAVNEGKTIVEMACPSGDAVREIYRKIQKQMQEDKG